MADLLDRLRLFRGGGGGNQNEGSGNRRSCSPSDPDRSRIKRALFGPVDHEANRRFVEEELAKSQRVMTDRYNFDFVNDRPLDGRWQWEISGAPPTTAAFANSDQVVPEVAPVNNTVSDKEEQKENSGIVNSNLAINIASTSPASSSAATTTASTSIPVISSTTVASGSSAANSSSSCDIAASAVSAASSNTSSCRASSAKPICQKSSMPSRHQNKKITEHFPQRKRSKSKVKTQERKPESEQLELSQPPTLSAATTSAGTKAE